jgi:N-acetylneuraminic acid mutarotase
MKRLSVTVASTLITFFSFAQNVGIGTTNPQQKLHVAGNVRIDALAGTAGILKYNSNGDLVPLANSGNSNEALLGNGTWGNINGTVPAGTIVATENYNDALLMSKGFTLLGNIPGFYKYINSSYTAAANSWAVTYYKGNILKYTPPLFDPNHLIVWADTVTYVYSEDVLYAYNPVADTWRLVTTNTSSYSASPSSKMVWTGTELIVFGGYYTNATNNGFRYNPATNIWSGIPTINQPLSRIEFAMHFINGRVVVWGGRDVFAASFFNNGAMLDLASNTWITMSAVNAPAPRYDFPSVQTSSNTMIVWGGSGPIVGVHGDGGIFNPATNTWSATSNTNAPTARRNHTAVWSGTEMIVFGGTDLNATVFFSSGARYNPSTNTWAAIANSPSGRLFHSAVWTGTRMLISGGIIGTGTNNPALGDSYLYNPSGNSWSAGGATGVQLRNHKSMLAGNIVLLLGGYPSVFNPLSGEYVQTVTWKQGSRYFLASTATSRTQIQAVDDLYLYIKQ